MLKEKLNKKVTTKNEIKKIKKEMESLESEINETINEISIYEGRLQRLNRLPKSSEEEKKEIVKNLVFLNEVFLPRAENRLRTLRRQYDLILKSKEEDSQMGQE